MIYNRRVSILNQQETPEYLHVPSNKDHRHWRRLGIVW